MTGIEKSEKKVSCFTRYIHFLSNQRAGIILPVLFIVVLILFQVITTMIFLTASTWQNLSGFYIGAVEYGLLLFLIVSWLVSMQLLYFKRYYEKGFRFAVPIVLFFGAFVSLVSPLFLPSMISGWPLDTVYSNTRQQHFILAYQPAVSEICYRIFSTNRSLLDPKWTIEFSGTTLDYSEDGSLTDDPQLILSDDEELLVVKRGGHFTDAILINSKQPLTESVPWSDADREKQWQQRTNKIKSLLQKHSTKSESD